MSQIHGKNVVPCLEEGVVDCRIGLGSRVRRHIHMLCAKEFLGPVNRQLLSSIYILTTSIPPAPRISFGILIGEKRTLRFKNRSTHKILGGNQFHMISLPPSFRGTSG